MERLVSFAYDVLYILPENVSFLVFFCGRKFSAADNDKNYLYA